MSDENLLEIVSTPVSSIGDVVAVMRDIDRDLTADDGLKWFNLLYLTVTEAVLAETVDHAWNDPAWLARLDVVFAKLYFDAVRDMLVSPGSVHKPWEVLFAARRKPHIMRVQHAICGMNAHINHDLQFALVRTGEDLGIAPVSGSPQHADFEFVNGILEAVMPGVKEFLAVGVVGEIDQDLGRVDDRLAIWSVKKAREFAWGSAERFWSFRNLPGALDAKHFETDIPGGLTGNLLLAPSF